MGHILGPELPDLVLNGHEVVKLLAEDLEAGDGQKCGRLRMFVLGTRDAALNWALEYGDRLRAAGYTQGRSNPCLFHNKSLGVSVGGDFVAVRPDQHLFETCKTFD